MTTERQWFLFQLLFAKHQPLHITGIIEQVHLNCECKQCKRKTRWVLTSYDPSPRAILTRLSAVIVHWVFGLLELPFKPVLKTTVNFHSNRKKLKATALWPSVFIGQVLWLTPFAETRETETNMNLYNLSKLFNLSLNWNLLWQLIVNFV